MINLNRRIAGVLLARALERYREKNALVLAIPRGGIPIGYEVAKFLNADFSIVIVRKLPHPDEPDTEFGAVGEDGRILFFSWAHELNHKHDVYQILAEQDNGIKSDIKTLRADKPIPNMEQRTVILVDDGLMTDMIMRIAIRLCWNRGASRIVVAVPVAAPCTAEEIKPLVDDLVVLHNPGSCQPETPAADHWQEVSDLEIAAVMQNFQPM